MRQSKLSIIFQITFPLVMAACIVFCFAYFRQKSTPKVDFGVYYNQKCEAYRMENAYLSKGQIVFIGDSITDLYHLDDYYADPKKWNWQKYMEELMTLQNRGYCLGFHDGKLTNLSQNYEYTRTLGDWLFAYHSRENITLDSALDFSVARSVFIEV